MKKLIVAALFGSLVSVSAMAGEVGPKVLTGSEMDKVTAAGDVHVTQYATAIAYGNYSTAIASNYSYVEVKNYYKKHDFKKPRFKKHDGKKRY